SAGSAIPDSAGAPDTAVAEQRPPEPPAPPAPPLPVGTAQPAPPAPPEPHKPAAPPSPPGPPGTPEPPAPPSPADQPPAVPPDPVPVAPGVPLPMSGRPVAAWMGALTASSICCCAACIGEVPMGALKPSSPKSAPPV